MSRWRLRSEVHQEGRDAREYRWCVGWPGAAGHYAPREEFARCRREGRQRRCKRCHAGNMRVWRAKKRNENTKVRERLREAEEMLQAEQPDRWAQLAAKYGLDQSDPTADTADS